MGDEERVSTGIAGLDRVLHGGLPKGRITLIEGAPGTGKTTLALQFLLAAVAREEKALFLSIAQSPSELDVIARSHGIDLTGVEIYSPEIGDVDDARVFSVDTDEAQLVQLIDALHNRLDNAKPDCFVFDSLLELRLLASSAVGYRRELLGLRQRLRDAGVTALLLDHLEPAGGERHAEGIVHGVIRLEAKTPAIGIVQRRLTALKMRGMDFSEGYHDLRIRTGGVVVFPRVVPSESCETLSTRQLAPPQASLREMLGGGLEYGTTTLISGQSGTGKSTMATVFAVAAAQEGGKAAMFLFEERPEVFRARSEGVGLPLNEHEARGAITLSHFDPAETSPGEFSRHVIEAVEEEEITLVVIDSLSGYIAALPDRNNVMTHLVALLQYLARRGVVVIVNLAQHGLLGEPPRSEVDASYLADTIILLRQYTAGTEIRRSIGVLKKRHSDHSRGIGELVIRTGSVDIESLSPEVAMRAAVAMDLGQR